MGYGGLDIWCPIAAGHEQHMRRDDGLLMDGRADSGRAPGIDRNGMGSGQRKTTEGCSGVVVGWLRLVSGKGGDQHGEGE